MRIAAEYERRIANEWKSSMNGYTNPYTAVCVSGLKDATPFRTEREGQAVQGQVKDALGVSIGMDGLFYVVRSCV
jgi:hypothetical protein